MNLTGPKGVFDMGHVLTHVLLIGIAAMLYMKWFHTPSAPAKEAPVVVAPLSPNLAPAPPLPQPSVTPQIQENPIDSLRQLYPAP
jgi:hypothetical protein